VAVFFFALTAKPRRREDFTRRREGRKERNGKAKKGSPGRTLSLSVSFCCSHLSGATKLFEERKEGRKAFAILGACDFFAFRWISTRERIGTETEQKEKETETERETETETETERG
jgi:hypothetical protein